MRKKLFVCLVCGTAAETPTEMQAKNNCEGNCPLCTVLCWEDKLKYGPDGLVLGFKNGAVVAMPQKAPCKPAKIEVRFEP